MATTNPIAGIARAAVLVNLNIRVYSGRRKDKDTQDEVIREKGAGSRQAASVYKSLFAGSQEAQAIKTVEGKARQAHYRLTLPWDDNGARLLPAARMDEYTRTMRALHDEFDAAVHAFIDSYDNMVRKAAFELGKLFRREDYPSIVSLRRKYEFDVATTPVPVAGDFRLDIESEVQRDLIESYERTLKTRMDSASRELWERTHATLTRLVERLDNTGTEGRKARIFDSMLEQAHDLVGLLKDMNLTADPELDRMRLMLKDAIDGMTTDTLRESVVARQEVADKAKAALQSFDWGISEEEDGTYDGDLGNLDAFLGVAA